MNKNPLSEYPRPQFVRESYISLNGYWDYAFSDSHDVPAIFEGKILVPYSPESKLSEVNRFLEPGKYLFYQKEIDIEEGFLKNYLLIHFLAVDQIADVFFNGVQYIHHESR